MPTITGGQAVARSLVAHGVTDFFGLPGVQSDWLYNGIFDEGVPFDVYTTRHEQGAGYMALGYALTSDRVGVFSVVPGPGLLNATAALATAYGLGSRVLCLSGQIPSGFIDRGTGQLHEIVDQPAMTAPITRWQGRADSAEQIYPTLTEAFQRIDSGIPGPVKVELPADVLAQEIDDGPAPDPLEPDHPEIDHEALVQAAMVISSAERPLIVVGGGAIDAADQVRLLAERIGAPVSADRRGQGVLSARHPLSIVTPVAHRLWADADLVIAIGTRLQQHLQRWGSDERLRQVWINVDPAAATRLGDPRVSIVGRAEEAIPGLLDLLEGAAPERPDVAAARADFEADVSSLEPQLSYLRAIREALPDDGILVQDLTQVGYVARIGFPVYAPRTFVSPGYPGTLGYGFAAALGARVANPDTPVVAVLGDGGFMYTVAELATAVHYGIGVVALVFDNAAYGNVKRMQQEDYGGRVLGTDLTNPDFVALAESFGARGMRATTPDEVGRAVARAIELDGPTVVSIPMGDVPSPWRHFQLGRVRGQL